MTNIQFTPEEIEFLQAVFTSGIQVPVSHAEVIVSIKAKLSALNKNTDDNHRKN